MPADRDTLPLYGKQHGGRMKKDYSIDEVTASTPGLNYRRVYALLRSGKLAGARKEDGMWRIPAAAVDGLRRELAKANLAADALATKLGDHNVSEQIRQYHFRGIEKQSLLNGLRADLLEARDYESPEYVEALEKILALISDAVYVWTGDAWRISLPDGTSVETRSVSGAVPATVVDG